MRVLFLVLFLCHAAAADTATHPMSSIGEEQFMSLFRANQPIRSRLVSAEVVKAALRWAQTASTNKQPLPDLLVIEDSVIDGDFGSFGLNFTPVGKLPVTQRHGLLGWVGAAIVPLRVFFHHCEFRGKVDFSTTIFKGDASFQQSVFDQHVLFQDAIFEGIGHFVGATFHGDVAFWGAAFRQRSSFAYATFDNWAIFSQATFDDGANFAFDTFHGDAAFRGTSLKEIAHFNRFEDFARHIDFDNAKFVGTLDLTQARIDGTATFYRSTFNNDSFFVDINKELPARNGGEGSMEFHGVTFTGRVYFKNSTLARLSFSPTAPSPLTEGDLPAPSHEAVSPTTFGRTAVFSGLRCDNADFSEVEFHDYADFTGSKFISFVSFNSATFEQEANFTRAEFPSMHNSSQPKDRSGLGLDMDDVQFQKPVSLSWQQIDDKVKIEGPNGWKRLEETFARSGELQGQNECMYRDRVAEAADKNGSAKLLDDFEYWFWGYGIRPWRVIVWIVPTYLIFVCLYFSQTAGIAEGTGKGHAYWKRAAFSIAFALRTSWSLGYGYANARTPLFRVITTANSVVLKLMLICLFKTLTNLSPLLNELFRKLIPL
jgi:uncharacterized protein YjbI with pentapeptide repeats